MTQTWPLIEYLEQGGWIMLPLVVCSLVMWALILERIVAFRELGARRDLEVGAAIDLVARGASAEQAQGDGLCARVVRRFLQERSGRRDIDRDLLRLYAVQLEPTLSKNLATIAVLAAIAPLLGLLGTVIGMIETFEVISVFGTGNARAMASGISVAMVTTQTGLVVAVPGLLSSYILQRRAQRFGLRLQEITTALERSVAC